MNVSIVTAFPELFSDFLTTSIPGRAVSNGLVGVNLVNLRDFGRGNYRQLDDYAFGSGGMLFAAPQLKDALNAATEKFSGVKPFVIYPSPQGALITQEIIESLAHQEHVIIFCGHYEGIDERFTEKYVDLEISIGDCVLTGGEIPAMLIIDAMSRLVPGVVGKNKAVIEDSFYRGMLDNPNYTRPAIWEDSEVPGVLLSGNAGEISRWRRSEAAKRTLSRRPDLISRASIREYVSGGVSIALLAEDDGENLSGIFELCAAYDLGRPNIIASDKDTREALKARYPSAKVTGRISRLIDDDTMTVKIFGSSRVNALHSLEIKRRCLQHDGKILLVFATKDASLESEDIAGISTYLYENEIDCPPVVKIGIALDRILGKR